MPARSPLTAAKLQCSRRPDRHVGNPLVLFHAAKAVTSTESARVPTASRQAVCAGMFLPAKAQQKAYRRGRPCQ